MSGSTVQVWLWVIFKVWFRSLAYLVAVFCLVGAAFSVFAVIDPKEAKLADDLDPFGDPGSRWDAAKMLITYLVLSLVSFFSAGKMKVSKRGTEA